MPEIAQVLANSLKSDYPPVPAAIEPLVMALRKGVGNVMVPFYDHIEHRTRVPGAPLTQDQQAWDLMVQQRNMPAGIGGVSGVKVPNQSPVQVPPMIIGARG